jgi:hypothetical protein
MSVVSRVGCGEGRGPGKLVEVHSVCTLPGEGFSGGVVDRGNPGGARRKEIATKDIMTGCVGPEWKGCAGRADDGKVPY